MKIEMPEYKPLPIETKGKPFWRQIVIWLFKFRKYKLTKDYYFYIPWLGVCVLIPKGFIFDGASVPKIFWPLLSPTGIMLIPGILHDFGYRYNYFLDQNKEKIFINEGKAFFDNIFRKVGVYVNGMPIIDYVAWVALASFGFISWNKHRHGH